MFYELLSVVSLAFIAWFLLYPYNNYRVDWIRQSMFALRDELFDEAKNGKISFDSEAYKATRLALNGAIRFAHQISYSRLIAFRLLVRAAPARDELASAMSASSKADRELCMTYMTRADLLVIRHVLSSPFVLMFVLPPVLIFILGRAGIDVAGWLLKLCRKQIAEFNRLAFQEGVA